MERVELGQVWENSDHRIIIFDVVDTPWGDRLASVRQLGDKRNTIYNLTQTEIQKMYKLVWDPLAKGSRCNSCGYMNEYVKDLDYICYKCKAGY